MVAAQVARGGCPPPLAQHQRAQHQRAGAHLGGQAQHLTAAGTPLLPPALGGGTHLPLVLERCYSATPLSKDVLSQQQQDYYCNVGAAVRALQKVRAAPPDAAACALPMLFGPWRRRLLPADSQLARLH